MALGGSMLCVVLLNLHLSVLRRLLLLLKWLLLRRLLRLLLFCVVLLRLSIGVALLTRRGERYLSCLTFVLKDRLKLNVVLICSYALLRVTFLFLNDLGEVRLTLYFVWWTFLILNGLAARWDLIHQIRFAKWSIMVSSLHCFDLVLQLGSAGANRGNLLVADDYWLRVCAFTESYLVLVWSLCLDDVVDVTKEVSVAAMSLGTLVAQTQAVARPFEVTKVIGFENLVCESGLWNFGRTLRRHVQIDETLINTFCVFVAACFEYFGVDLARCCRNVAAWFVCLLSLWVGASLSDDCCLRIALNIPVRRRYLGISAVVDCVSVVTALLCYRFLLVQNWLLVHTVNLSVHKIDRIIFWDRKSRQILSKRSL